MLAPCLHTSYAALLAAPYTLVTAQLRARVRQEKRRKKLGSHEDAF